jgi:hypothetical protein
MRILIVKISAMGDILHALPVLDYLKQASDRLGCRRGFCRSTKRQPSDFTAPYRAVQKMEAETVFRRDNERDPERP